MFKACLTLDSDLVPFYEEITLDKIKPKKVYNYYGWSRGLYEKNQPPKKKKGEKVKNIFIEMSQKVLQHTKNKRLETVIFNDTSSLDFTDRTYYM